MKRLFCMFAAAAALSVTAATALAQGPPPGYAPGPPPGFAGGPPPGYAPGPPPGYAGGPPPGYAPGPPPGYGEQMYGGSAGYMGGPMGYGGPGGHIKSGFGGLGLLSGIFSNHPHKEKDQGQGQGQGQSGPVRNMIGGDRQQRIRNAQMLPTAQGGTLVYPQNPFVRSPRDFFMWDEK